MDIKLNVKDKSVFHFFSEKLIGYRPNERHTIREDESAYYLMKDEMYLKKEIGLEEGELVKFELADNSMMSRKELRNTYIYKVEKYDDVSVKLVLSDFKIEAV